MRKMAVLEGRVYTAIQPLRSISRPLHPVALCWTSTSSPTHQIVRHISASSKPAKPNTTLNGTTQIPHPTASTFASVQDQKIVSSSSAPASGVVEQVTSPHAAPLALLPLTSILRTYLITTVSSSPALLSLTSSLLHRMLKSKSILFNVDRNPLLRWLLKKTFYAQFCAGEDKPEVQKFIKGLEGVGYNGVCLEYAMEVLEGEDHGKEISEAEGIKRWTDGVVETIEMSKPGSFMAFKYSGMGPAAFTLLKNNAAPSEAMDKALTQVCDAAAANNIRLLPAAEPQNAQKAVDDWSLRLARRYNTNGLALIYNTYQCYLKHIPAEIASHIVIAEKEGFVLGAKLVRGAYMETEARSVVHDTKEDTDKCYDGCAEALMKREYNDVLKPAGGRKTETKKMPKVDVFLATHNLESVERAMLIKEQLQRTSSSDTIAELGEVSYSQLLGMADEVSCALLAAQKKPENVESGEPKVYKYCTWGTLSQCLNYLLRRAAENRDAMGRTKETARAMRGEILRRMRLG